MSRALPEAKRRARDAYYTPDALASALVGLLDVDGLTVWEPHVGGGAFASAARDAGASLYISDVHDTSVAAAMDLQPRAAAVADFVDLKWAPDWIIGNPPYRQAEEHIRHALTCCDRVAFLLRLGVLESTKRAPLWVDHPPAVVHVLQQRPSFTGGGTDSAAYGFFVWEPHEGPTALRWLSWR